MVTIVARYRTRPGAGDTVAAILAKHVAATRAEPGCTQFDACRSRENPDEFVLYEKYVNEEAFGSHRKSPHFASYIEGQVVPLLDERTWERYEEVAI
jgi:quinol monooxygenase YgiN